MLYRLTVACPLYFCGVSCNFSSLISNQLPKALDNSGANNSLTRSIKGKRLLSCPQGFVTAREDLPGNLEGTCTPRAVDMLE